MMSLEQKKAYLGTIRRRYKKSSHQEKAKILGEFCSVCKYNRKYGVRLLVKKQKRGCPCKVRNIIEQNIGNKPKKHENPNAFYQSFNTTGRRLG